MPLAAYGHYDYLTSMRLREETEILKGDTPLPLEKTVWYFSFRPF